MKNKKKKKNTDAPIEQDSKKILKEDGLQKAIDTLEQEKGELLDKFQRVSADYANYQKRVPKQISDSVAYEREKILKSFLPALDNFEHTLQGAQGAESVDVLVKGIKIVYDQMSDVLKSHHVEQITAVDEHFDPMLHEAMLRRSEPDKEDGIILEEFQKGYSLNGRVLRPSKVVVNKIEDIQEDKEQQDEQDVQDSQASEPADTE